MLAQTERFTIFSEINSIHFFADSVCYNPCVGPLPITKISFFLLSIFVYKLISIPEIIPFLPVLPIGCKNNPCLSNPIPYPEYSYSSMSAFYLN